MRTSATGTSDRERGFTLIELLVVVTIMGLMAAAVVLAMPDRRSAVMADAREFAGRARAIRDKAMIDARATSIRVTPLGYAFDERTQGGWKPTNGDLTQGLLWRSGTRALVPDGAMMRIVFDSTGIAEPVRLTLERGDQRVAVTIAYDGTIDVAA